MSDKKDPQRISDAADNCEVLRARLAKYEDDQGNPKAPITDVVPRGFWVCTGPGSDGGISVNVGAAHGQSFIVAHGVMADFFIAVEKEQKRSESARLAKYEDADGNPISTIAEQARVILPPSPYMPGVEPEQMTDYERGEAQGRCDMWAEVIRLNAQAVSPSKRSDSAPNKLADGKVAVSGEALRTVLNALVNAPHTIRELQATREPVELFGDNPINVLVAEFNAAIEMAEEK